MVDPRHRESTYHLWMDDAPVRNGLPAMHPGELLREDVLPALGRTRAEIARLLGVSRQTRHAILNERAPVPPKWRFVRVSSAETSPSFGSPSKPVTTSND